MTLPYDFAELPLFPLGMVVSPGERFALNIFEIRYLYMIKKAFNEKTPFGVVSLIQGNEVQSAAQTDDASAGYAPETFAQIGTVCFVDELTTPKPGLIQVLCRGSERFKIGTSQRGQYGLWLAMANSLPLDPVVDIPPDLQFCANELGKFIKQMQESSTGNHPFSAPYHLEECAWVANRWLGLLPLPVSIKQRLLETASPLVRLELIADLLRQAGIESP